MQAVLVSTIALAVVIAVVVQRRDRRLGPGVLRVALTADEWRWVKSRRPYTIEFSSTFGRDCVTLDRLLIMIKAPRDIDALLRHFDIAPELRDFARRRTTLCEPGYSIFLGRCPRGGQKVYLECLASARILGMERTPDGACSERTYTTNEPLTLARMIEVVGHPDLCRALFELFAEVMFRKRPTHVKWSGEKTAFYIPILQDGIRVASSVMRGRLRRLWTLVGATPSAWRMIGWYLKHRRSVMTYVSLSSDRTINVYYKLDDHPAYTRARMPSWSDINIL